VATAGPVSIAAAGWTDVSNAAANAADVNKA
jgi:hypothetical protein